MRLLRAAPIDMPPQDSTDLGVSFNIIFLTQARCQGFRSEYFDYANASSGNSTKMLFPDNPPSVVHDNHLNQIVLMIFQFLKVCNGFVQMDLLRDQRLYVQFPFVQKIHHFAELLVAVQE